MNYLSVCSGIESASVAWSPLGWKPVGVAEIEPFPCALLHHHYGCGRPLFMPQKFVKANARLPEKHMGVPNYGDITRFREWPDIPRFGLLVGGTPCQSFSVAGLRQGLADPRGNLMLTYLAIAAEYRPEWLVWENVPGVLSVDAGHAFGTFIKGLEELGYHASWRVLDAQYVRVDGLGRAVPQRRRRVFVVGHLGDWRRAAAVLFDAESLSGNSPPRRKAGKGFAGEFEEGAGDGGERHLADVAPTLNSHFGDKMGLEDQHALNGAGLFVANSLRGEGHDASEEGTGRQNLIAFSAKDHGGDAGEISPTIRAGGHNGSHANARVMQAIAIQETANRDRGGPNGRGWKDDDSAFTLEARRAQTVAFDTTQITSKENGSNPQPGDPCHPLAAGAHAPAIANAWAVRRLMPVECERLQGFPDGYTNIPYRGRNTTPDGPRYKAIGNSKAINVVRWIGRRIEWVNSH